MITDINKISFNYSYFISSNNIRFMNADKFISRKLFFHGF